MYTQTFAVFYNCGAESYTLHADLQINVFKIDFVDFAAGYPCWYDATISMLPSAAQKPAALHAITCHAHLKLI